MDQSAPQKAALAHALYDDSAALEAAIARAWHAVPSLIGTDFEQFAAQVLSCLRLLETVGENHAAVRRDLLGLFQSHPTAQQALVEAFEDAGPDVTRSLAARPFTVPARHVVLPIFYATDRARTDTPTPNDFYGAERGPLAFGVVEVAIPDDHRKGRLEKPSLWRLQFRENPDKHVTLKGITELTRDAFRARARSELGASRARHALIFVHGYNVSFKDAARRAAQIAADLNFDGLPLLYSWPSEGDTIRYAVDETNITWARSHFHEFLELTLCELGVDTVSIIAHSMGNRALAETMATIEIEALPQPRARLRQVVFAAPDVDKDTFRDLAQSFGGRAERFTLYASSSDLALIASKKLHKYPRAGDVEPELLIARALDSIDATLVDTSFMGHSYFGDNRSVISDLFQLLRHDHPPPARGLTERLREKARYWVFT